MKAGTAQKAILNLLSTQIMLRLGHVHRGLMVDMRPQNIKLRARATGMVARLAQVDEGGRRKHALEAAGWKIKPAVLVAQGFDIAAADAALRQAQGVLRNVAGARAMTLRPELFVGQGGFDPALCAVGIALARTGPAWRFRGRRGPALGAPVVRAVGRITRDGAQGAGTADARRCAVAQTGVRAHLWPIRPAAQTAGDRAAFGAVGGVYSCPIWRRRGQWRPALSGWKRPSPPGITRGCACLWPAGRVAGRALFCAFAPRMMNRLPWNRLRCRRGSCPIWAK